MFNSSHNIANMINSEKNAKETTTAASGVSEVYNLIVLDRSGSMISIAPQAIAGVNETIGTIRAAGAKNELPQYVTVTTFCGCSTNDFCKDMPAKEVAAFTSASYQPCCTTPLYDALGEALMSLRTKVKGRTDVAVSVTVITDGYENASRKWSSADISALIKLLKADGWLFAYIGANQDVEKVSSKLSIDNALAFEATPEGTERMFARERSARMHWSDRIVEEAPSCCCTSYFSEPDDDVETPSPAYKA